MSSRGEKLDTLFKGGAQWVLRGCITPTLTQGFRHMTTARITTSATYCLNKNANRANRLYAIPSALPDCAWEKGGGEGRC